MVILECVYRQMQHGYKARVIDFKMGEQRHKYVRNNNELPEVILPQRLHRQKIYSESREVRSCNQRPFVLSSFALLSVIYIPVPGSTCQSEDDTSTVHQCDVKIK